MLTMACLRCIISGRVQGVGFRYSTRLEAIRLKLTGSATNLVDGKVEVIVCGNPDALQIFNSWLWRGSEWAGVTNVECEPVDLAHYNNFQTG